MSLVTANTLENLNFKFVELRKLSIAKKLDTNVINNVAISHNHQVIFAAYENAFKVIKISTLLDFEWSKNVVNQIVDSYPSIEIRLSFKPFLLSVSGGSNNLLLVLGQNSSNNLSGDIYYIPNLLANDPNPINRIAFPSSISSNVHIKSVAWHPEFSETLFAAALSDGALVTIGIDNQTKGIQILSHYTDSFKFTCVSWSPKGKQLVVGGDNGQLTQFKHQNGKNFQKAKIIPPPKELPNHKIINVNWVHSALFQVAFIHNSSTSNPDTRVVFIHAPPKATIEYYDFGSVCMETSQYGGPDKIQFCFSQIGNILLCLSSISSEVALIGCDAGEINPIPNQWSQWILDDTSRIELQPDANNVESSPCGISWFKGPTKIFKVNESVSFGGPGWPLVVILSSAGVLCPYYAYHNQGKLIIPDFTVSQPLPITLPPPARISSSEVQLSGQQSAPQIPISKSSAQPFQIQPSQAADASFTFSLSKSAQPKPQTTLSVSATIQAPGQPQQQPQSVPPNSSQPPKPTQQQLQQQQTQQFQLSQQQIQQPQNFQPQAPQQQVSSKPAISEEELRKKEQEVLEETFSVAIQEEINEFTKTFQNAKNNFSKALKLQIGKPDELSVLQSETSNLTELLKTSSDTLKSLDLSMLNGYLLETWAMVQEATTRLEKESDPVYTMLANRRSLDPITARKMREIKKIAHDIELQLEDFNNMLDREWDEYTAKMSSKKPGKTLSSIDMIYHTLSTHHKTIEILKKNLAKYDKFTKSIEFEDDSVVSPRRKEIQEIINSLRNTSLQEDNSMNESCQLKSFIKVPNVTKEKKERLLEFFEQRNTVPSRRAILPVDLKSSKMVSAVVKAKERLKEIRAKAVEKAASPVKQSFSPVLNLTSSKPEDLNTTLQTTQTTPVKPSEKGDRIEDKSLFYTTAIGDMSIADTSKYQSPSKTFSFLSPISTKSDPRLPQKSQPLSENSLFKEPEPADKSTPFVGKSNTKTDTKEDANLSFSFSSTTLTNIASPTLSSSTFLFSSSKPMGSEKAFASTFATATKDIAPIVEPSKETLSTAKENVQVKNEPKETKPFSFSLSSTPSSTTTTRTEAQSAPKPQPLPDIATFKSTKEPESADVSSTSKTDTKAEVKENTNLSFSTTNLASPTLSSTFLFGTNKPQGPEKSFASSFTTATKDISIIEEPKKELPSSIKENVQSKNESQDSKPFTFSLDNTFGTITPKTETNQQNLTPKPQAPPENTPLKESEPADKSTSFIAKTEVKSDVKEDISSTTPSFPPSSTASTNIASSTVSSTFLFSTQTTASSPSGFNFNAALANLGGQPSQDTPTKNPFGSPATSLAPQPGLFAAKTAVQTSTFGTPPSLSSSFTSQTTAVAQTGFSIFGNQGQPRFGAQPTFGGAPAFGTQPTFGGSPTFGNTMPFGKTMSGTSLGFGQSSAPPVTKPAEAASPFAGFANANTPSFGALASQQTPSFGQLASTTQPVPAQQQQPATGSLFGGFSQTSAPSMAKPAEAASPFSSFSSAPSFGALASQQAPSFGQLASTAQPVPAQQQQQQQKPATGSLFGGFGQANVSSSSSIFGNTFPSAPVFGSPQFSQRRQ
ncbi:nuclear pore complex protein Nup214 isoform X1 [Tetranychus urticae]|uniref:nuclear pore complex protein Nup214 isoform X1 n=1 Tax=Tetranychus urticae TaxID=32264 RepID=UPI00077B85D0|nr:nuclear pore complex protein Nup214 isoform X1 [Tetranychus urticae]